MKSHLAPSHSGARPAADALIVFEDSSTWMPKLNTFLRGRLKKGHLDRWHAHDFSNLYDDDSEWTDILAGELKDGLERIEADLADWLSAKVVRLVHGCRPVSLASYMQHGIRAYVPCTFQKTLEEWLMKKGVAPHRHAIMDRAESLSDRGDDPSVFLALDERDLLRRSGHYVVYGSEWLTSVLGSSCRGLLKRVGVPTLLYVKWPLASASQAERLQFSRRLLREWIRLTCLSAAAPSFADFTFVAAGGVSAGLIQGHWHPSAIVDPLEGFRRYRNRRRECDVCRIA